MVQLAFSFMRHCRGWQCAWGGAALAPTHAHRSDSELDGLCLCNCGRCMQRRVVTHMRQTLPFHDSLELLKRRQAQVGWS
jgi:hypothetical protein